MRRRRWWLLPLSVLPEGALGGAFSPDAAEVVGVDARTDLSAALWQLGAGPRGALVLRYYHSLSDSEIAAELRVPLGTVKSWLHRSLERLRRMQQLDGYGGRASVGTSGRPAAGGHA